MCLNSGTAVSFPKESGDTRINVSGNQASLYFEYHDIGDYDLPTRFIAPDTFLVPALVPLSRQVPHSGRCASSANNPALDRTPSRKSSRLTLGTESGVHTYNWIKNIEIIDGRTKACLEDHILVKKTS